MTETADEPLASRRSARRTPRRSSSSTRKDFVSDQEVRWCPGCGDYSILAQTQKVMPDFGYPEGEHRLHQRHRLLRPAAVLHEHVRLPHDPRPGADDRDRAQGRPAGPDGLGHHRRRRRAVDRRQPPPPLDAPQRGHQDHHVQQPDLRPDQGPGVARRRSSARSRSRRRTARSTTRSARSSVALAAEATFIARSVDTHTEHLQHTLERGRPAPGLGVRRGPPELQHLQRRRLARVHRPRGPRRPDARPRARQADDLRQGPRQGHPPQRPPAGGRRRSASTGSPRRTSSSTTRRRGPLPRVHAVAHVLARSSRCRSA